MNAGTPSLVDDLYRRLQAQVVSGELLPGASLPTQKELADREKVSRTVVREAVARLAAQGLVTSRQGAGVFVADSAHYRAFQIAPEEIAELEDVLKVLELRMAIESETASLAAARRSYDDLERLRECLNAMDRSTTVDESVQADAAFHAAIAAATRNEYFQRFLDFLGTRLVPPRSLHLRNQPTEAHEEYARKLAADHRAIFDAIADQDPVKARAAARFHMQQSMERHARLGRLK